MKNGVNEIINWTGKSRRKKKVSTAETHSNFDGGRSRRVVTPETNTFSLLSSKPSGKKKWGLP